MQCGWKNSNTYPVPNVLFSENPAHQSWIPVLLSIVFARLWEASERPAVLFLDFLDSLLSVQIPADNFSSVLYYSLFTVILLLRPYSFYSASTSREGDLSSEKECSVRWSCLRSCCFNSSQRAECRDPYVSWRRRVGEDLGVFFSILVLFAVSKKDIWFCN